MPRRLYVVVLMVALAQAMRQATLMQLSMLAEALVV